MEVLNVHTRVIHHPIEKLRPWIEELWSNTDRDAFPRDYLPDFRRNPEGVDPTSLIPGVTRLGHGLARFRFEGWDGHRWDATVVSRRLSGRHGFTLEPQGNSTRITHRLEVKSPWAEWSLLIRPIHDWAVEAVFDRLETALSTGRVPPRTARPMHWYVRLLFAASRWLYKFGVIRNW